MLRSAGGENWGVSETARKSFVATSVAVAVVALALALWKLKVLVALLLLALIVAAAMRPGVEWLHRRRVPRGAGVAIHYARPADRVGLLLWLIVPRALDQVEQALGHASDLGRRPGKAARNTHGLKHESWSASSTGSSGCRADGLIHPAIRWTRTALEVLVGVFFTFAVGAYWIFEKERAQRLVLGLVSPRAGGSCATPGT